MSQEREYTGEVFKFSEKGITLKVMPGNSCKDCYFSELNTNGEYKCRDIDLSGDEMEAIRFERENDLHEDCDDDTEIDGEFYDGIHYVLFETKKYPRIKLTF